jgi:hypothetical protein
MRSAVVSTATKQIIHDDMQIIGGGVGAAGLFEVA